MSESGTSPTFTKALMNLAESAQTLMSVNSTMDAPAPAARPLTAPMTGFSSLRPSTAGVRVAVASAAGTPLFEAQVPPGAFDGLKGWKFSPGKSWTFSTRSPAANGITKVQVVHRPSTTAPGLVKVVVVGSAGTYPVASADLPLRLSVTLGDRTDAVLGRCGETSFAAGACVSGGGGTTVACKR